MITNTTYYYWWYVTATIHPHYYTTALDIIWRVQIAWGQVCFILGSLGNIYVLYATIAHNAIKLDKMSIWIIQNLAVADICNCVLVLLPILITQYGKLCKIRIFGEKLYTFLGCYRYTFVVVNLYLVNMLSLNKLMRCVDPLRNLDSTWRQRKTVTAVTVFLTSIPTLWIVYGLIDGFLYIKNQWWILNYLGSDKIGYVIYLTEEIGETRKIMNYAIICAFNALPCISLVIVNSTLLIFAWINANSAINKRNLVTVTLVTVTFLISVIPQFVSFMPLRISSEYEEIAWSFIFLSAWINPFIYLALNPTFRKFTKTTMRRMGQCLNMVNKSDEEPKSKSSSNWVG